MFSGVRASNLPCLNSQDSFAFASPLCLDIKIPRFDGDLLFTSKSLGMNMIDSVSQAATLLNDYQHLGASLKQWLQLAFGGICLWALLRFLIKRVSRRLKRIAESSATQWDDILLLAIRKTHGFCLFAFSLFLCAKAMGLAPAAMDIIYKVVMIASFFQVALWGNEILQHWLSFYLMNRNGQRERVDLSTYSAINITAKFLLYVLLLLLLLDNLGVNITALVTGLGIGGIAIALAVQNILGDIFASLTIVLDRPFEVGDFIVVDGRKGTVETVGLKTSRVRSLSGEQLVFPNKKLIESYIQNFKRMQERRVAFKVGVAYETPLPELRAIPQLIKDIIAAQPQTRVDHVHLLEYGDQSLIYEVVYFMTTPDNSLAMDVRQEVNLRILELFSERGIDFTSPSRSIVDSGSRPGLAVEGQKGIQPK